MAHVRDAEATRRRLLDAATAEFAAHGIAGARVDRIAAAARSNKAQIYHYYRSKDGLLDAVLADFVARFTTSEAFDAADLPGTAGVLFDFFEEDPDRARLVLWWQLESQAAGAHGRNVEVIEAANAKKLVAIAAAQESGKITTDFPPEVLHDLVTTIASLWSTFAPGFGGRPRERTAAERRALVVRAVERLVAP